MAGGDDKFTITVMVGSQKFTPTVDRSEEELYRKAAEYINAKIATWRNKTSKLTEIQNVSLVAYEIALELMKTREDHQEFLSGMEKLNELLDSKK